MDRASTPWSTRIVRSAPSSTCNTLATLPSTRRVLPPSPHLPRGVPRAVAVPRLPEVEDAVGERVACATATRAVTGAKAAALRANGPTPEARAQTHKQTLTRTNKQTNKPPARTRPDPVHARANERLEPSRTGETPPRTEPREGYPIPSAAPGRGPVCLLVSLFACLWGADHTYLRPKSCRSGTRSAARAAR